MEIVTGILEFIRRPRVVDAALRTLILSCIVAVAISSAAIWSTFYKACQTLFSTVFSSLLSLAVMAFVFLIFIAPLVSATTKKNTFGWLGKALMKGVTRSVQIIVMTTVNTFILVVSIVLAACQKENVGVRVVEACTHYLERQADLLVRWMAK